MHGFVDESRRGTTYLLACVVISPKSLGGARATLRQLLLPGQRRIHLTDETKRRAFLLDAYADLEVAAWLYSITAQVREERAARERCLAALVDDLLAMDARRLVLESREGRDHHDRAVIHSRVQRSNHELAYEHLLPREEPLLWVADGFAWSQGAGGTWRQRVAPRIRHLRDLDAG